MEIECWPCRVPGPDPTIQFWIQHPDGVRHRLCDGEVWEEVTEEVRIPVAYQGLEIFVPCRACKEIHLADLRHRHLLHLMPDAPHFVGIDNREKSSHMIDKDHDMANNSKHIPDKNRDTPDDLQGFLRMSTAQTDFTPRIPLSLFARFYEARPAAQVGIVRDIRVRLFNPREYRRRDYYMALRNLFERSHWATGSITVLEDAFGVFKNQAGEADLLKTLGAKYLSFWLQTERTYFRVHPVDVPLGGLVIIVRPEIGMQVGGDQQVLKLWLNTKPPSRQNRQIVHYMMERARDESPLWQGDWHVGMLDLPRKRIPLPIAPAKDFMMGLMGQAAAFVEIWRQLDEEALSIGE